MAVFTIDSSSTVPAPTNIFPCITLLNFRISSRAPGEFIVISIACTPPACKASATGITLAGSSPRRIATIFVRNNRSRPEFFGFIVLIGFSSYNNIHDNRNQDNLYNVSEHEDQQSFYNCLQPGYFEELPICHRKGNKHDYEGDGCKSNCYIFSGKIGQWQRDY